MTYAQITARKAQAEGIAAVKFFARTQSTETLIEAIKLIGGGLVSVDRRMARACMIDIYTERAGEAATNVLLGELGMLDEFDM